jgi:hypothetical protein
VGGDALSELESIILDPTTATTSEASSRWGCMMERKKKKSQMVEGCGGGDMVSRRSG